MKMPLQHWWYAAVLTVFAVSAITHDSIVLVTLLPTANPVINPLGSVAGGDFPAFYTAGTMTLNGAASAVWDRSLFNIEIYKIFGVHFSDLNFFYPPVALLLWTPFALLPYNFALWLWSALPLAAFGWCVYRLTRHWPATLLALLAPLTIYTVCAGQTGVFFADLTAAFAINLKDRPMRAAGLASLFVIKPHLAPALPLCLLVERKWRALAFLAGLIASILLTTTTLFGYDVWFAFFRNVIFHAREYFNTQNVIFDRSLSIQLLCLRLGIDYYLSWCIQGIISLITAILLIFIWRKSRDMMYRMLSLSLAICLMAPKVMHYDAAALSIPVAMIIARFEYDGVEPGFILLAIAIWFLPLLVPLFTRLGFDPGGVVLFAGMILTYLKAGQARKASPLEADALAD